jgi:tetratricopeptide (TPR) repeat protein
MKTLPGLALALALPLLAPAFSSPAHAQNGPTEIIGSHYRGPAERSAEAYSRGAKAKRKAEGETDPAKQKKGFERAKKELLQAVSFEPNNFDALLALGQVYLALEDAQPGRESCSRALGLRPSHADAKSCVEQASAVVLAQTKKPGDAPANP